MAQCCPSYILDTVLKQLESPLFQSCNKKLNFSLLHTQLRDLRSKLELIREVIDDAEGMGVLFPKIVGYWVCELQFVLHEVDDLLDEALTRSMPASDMVEKVRLQLANMRFGLTLAHKMKKLNKRLDRIVEKCYECNLFVVDSSHQSQPPRKPVPRKGILRYDPDDHVKDDEELQMIGRDNDKRKVIEMLLWRSSTYRRICVFGEPGVGKTTLCRAVFNDVQVKDWFEIQLWFNLCHGSEDDWCKKILSELGADEEASINNKRFLLVLDNFYWRRDNKLETILDRSHRGSKILVIGYLAAVPDHYIYRLRGVSEDDSLSIFNKTGPVVIGDDRHDLREKIVSKCRGNPALLKAVGTLLYGNGDMTEKWEYLAHNFDSSVRYRHYDQISRLNARFPRCLCNVGYLSIFLNGEIKKSSLIHHFAAHGFTTLSSYDLAGGNVTFSLIQASSKDNWDVEDNFTVGHYYRDLISQIAGGESTTARCTEAGIHEAARHVSIVRPSSPVVQRTHEIMLPHGSITDTTHRRTLLFLGDLPIKMSIQTLDMLASNLQYLRVLDLHDLALQTLPSSIGKLIHLRYLDLSRNEFKMLPNSILKLKNLQTLKLFYCDKLIKLPRRIDILGHLKNLEINMCLDLTLMPSTIARLTRLENLDRFVVNPHKGGLRYLEHLNNLNGDLAIELPRRWKASATTEAEQAKLEEKKGLTTLRFRWPGIDNGGDSNDSIDNDVVLDKLKPWGGIKYLSIVNFGGTTIPSWVTSLRVVESSCLSEIVISRCKHCTKLPSFHRMPKLRVLTLTSIMNIEYLQDNSCDSDVSVFFPSLKELKIGEMPNLKGWSKDLGGLPKFPYVDYLSIWCCPRLTIMPPFTRIRYNVTLQVVSEELIQLIGGLNVQCLNVSVISIPHMVVLPGEFVNKLPRKLTIKDCKQLQMLWTDEVQGEEARKSMSNLRRLYISNAPALKHMRSSLQQLSYLEVLYLSGCDEELDCLYNKDKDGMPWKALTFLSHLEIKGFQKLVFLPNGFRCLRSLKELTIENCKALKWEVASLPPKLKKLCIKSCPLFPERIEDIRREHPYLDFV